MLLDQEEERLEDFGWQPQGRPAAKQHAFGRVERKRIAAASGFLMVLSFIVLSVFPVIEVESVGAYAAKIGAVVVAAETIGASLFVAPRRAGRQP